MPSLEKSRLQAPSYENPIEHFRFRRDIQEESFTYKSIERTFDTIITGAHLRVDRPTRLKQILEKTRGFVTMVAVGNSCDQDEPVQIFLAEELSTLDPEHTPIVGFLENPSYFFGAEALYPAVMEGMRADSIIHFLQTLPQKNELRQETQKIAARRLILETFKDKHPQEVKRLIKKWATGMQTDANWLQHKRNPNATISPLRRLKLTLNEVGISLTPEHRIVELPFKRYQRGMDYQSAFSLGSAICMLAVITGRPIEDVTDALGGVADVVKSAAHLDTEGERIIAKLALTNSGGPNRLPFALNRREFSLLSHMANGRTSEQVMRLFSLEDSGSVRTQLTSLLGQFSFRRSPGNYHLFMRAYLKEHGMHTYVQKSIEFAEETLDYSLPEENRTPRNIALLKHVKIVARRWLKLSDESMSQAMEDYSRTGKASSLLTVHQNLSKVTAFINALEKYILDESTVSAIYTAPRLISDEERVTAYKSALLTVDRLKLVYVLPRRGLDLISYMDKFIEGFRLGYRKNALDLYLSTHFISENSFSSIRDNNADVFMDILRLCSEPHIDSTQIFHSWALMRMADHIRAILGEDPESVIE